MRRRTLSLRLRLTLSYGGVFFTLGFVLIALSYVLVHQVLIHNPGEFLDHIAEQLGLSPAFLASRMPSPAGGHETVATFMRTVQDRIVSQLLHGLTLLAFTSLAVAAVLSVGLGWLIAGRMLRPLQEIAAAARRASTSTLHERIAMQGPSDELRELADTFDAMLARLESAFEAQRDFVANASHELRTPLAIMRTEVDVTLADRRASGAELRRMAEAVRSAVARSEDIVDRLLVLAESEQLTDSQTVDLCAVVQEAIALHSHAGEARGLSFDAELEPASVQGDRMLLEHLVGNLVDNAVKYATEGSVIKASLDATQRFATLCLANSGEVITLSELAHLFERFYRRGTARSRSNGGTGLGLAIVAAVAEAHGGSIDAQGPAAGGLVVTVRLPLSQASQHAKREMKHYRLRSVVLAGSRRGFKEGLLWQQPDGIWGVELAGATDLRDLVPNRPLSLAAQREDDTWLLGEVVILSLGELDFSGDRLHFSGTDKLRTAAR